MNKRTHLAALALAVGLPLAVIGCGNTTNPNATPVASTDKPVPATAKRAAEKPVAETPVADTAEKAAADAAKPAATTATTTSTTTTSSSSTTTSSGLMGAVSSMGSKVMDAAQSKFVKSTLATLSSMKSKLDSLAGDPSTQNLTGDTKTEYEQANQSALDQITNLTSQLGQLSKITDTSSDQWTTLKSSITQGMTQLTTTYNKVLSLVGSGSDNAGD